MNAEELRQRLKNFSYRSVKVCEALPTTNTANVISKQLIRSALSAAANYRAATRAQSKKQFLAKLNIALEELDESYFWLESVRDLNLLTEEKLELILAEGDELIRILSATKNTTRRNLQQEATDQKSTNHKS